MSWTSINEMLGLAAVDQEFCQELLTHPLAAAQARGFELTLQEQETLREISARDLYEFSQMVLDRLAPESQ